jgi:hypothetical protein
MINADISKATAEDRQTALDRMVEENKKNAEQGQSDLETAVNVQKSEDDYKKYEIGGTEAFYLLPTGTPLPDMLLDFKVLDLIDGRTTIYAYQALYNKSDTSGLGGKGLTGKRESYEDVAEVAIKDIKNLVTVLMSYDTKNQTYKVFYHSITPCTAEYLSGGTDQDKSKTTLSVKPAVSSDSNIFASSNDFYNIFTQKVNDNCYMIFENCVGRFYNRNGSLVATYDLNANLDEISTIGSGKAKYNYNISKVVCDKNRYMYTLINAEKEGITLDDTVKEEDLEKTTDDNDKDVYQLLLCNFNLNLGLHEAKETAEDGTVSTVTKGYFVSKNLSFQNQVDAWMKDNHEIYDLGVDNGLDTNRDSEVTAKAKELAISYQSATAGDNANSFAPYQYDEESLDAYLYTRKAGSGYRIALDPGQLNQELLNLQNKGSVIYYAYFPSDAIKDSGSSNGLAHSFVQRLGRSSLYQYFLIPNGRLAEQELVKVTMTKVVTLTWKHEEVVTGEDGEEETSEEEYSFDVPITQDFDQYFRTYFKENKEAQLINWRYTSNDIAASSGNGLIRYGTTGLEDQETSFMRWETTGGNLISGFYYTTKGRARNLYMHQTAKDHAMVMTGDKNLLIVRGSDSGWSASEIKNRYLSFGFDVDSSGMEVLNQMKLSELGAENSGTAADTVLTVADDDAVDNYLDVGICFGKANPDDLYLAGPTSGIVCYRMAKNNVIGKDADNNDIHTASQISSYPYYGIWIDNPSDGTDRSCKAIGYQTDLYAYDMSDLFRAKLYTVGLTDDAANTNRLLSVLEKYPALQSRLMSGIEAWNELMTGLGITSEWNTEGRADTATIRKYYDYLIKDEKNRKQAVDLFLTMAHCSSDQATALSTDTAFVEELKNCYYRSELETLMVKYIDKMYPEAAQNITVSDYEVLPGADKAVEGAAADSTSAALAEEEQKQEKEQKEEQKQEEQKQLKEQQAEQQKQKQELERDRKIIENIKEAGGYLMNDESKAKWDSGLDEILSLLHGEFDTGQTKAQDSDTQNSGAQNQKTQS